MKLVNTFVGIQYVLQIASVLSTLTGKNKQHSKQFTLSCTGLDYSARRQRMLQNDNDISSETFKGLYPEGQEVLYSYSAVITTGTKSPAQFVSQFNLTGNIKVQGFKNKARVQFLNLKYTMYSGDFLSEKKLKIAKLPEGSAPLYEPFDIFYKDGQVSKLEVTSGTPQWSKSIKQALSGLLQLDLRKIDTEKFTSFVSTEQSIHGNCAVLYSVKPQQNKLHVTKFHGADDCQRETAEWSNVEAVPGCLNVGSQNNLASFSQKTYRVTPFSDDTLLIREVFSEGKTFRFHSKNSNSSHYITVSQKLQLVSMNGITRVAEISNPEEISTLEFDATQFNSFKFSTNENLDNVVKKVFHLLSAVRSELEGKNSLLSEQVNPQESHLVPLLITYMRKLDLDLLQLIHNELEKKDDNMSSMDTFIKILPLVGSKDSALFIVNLLKGNKVVNYDAELIVSALPFHTRQVAEEHLIEFEDLLYLPESTSNSVRNAAVLSFATLVYETCKLDRCKPETIDKYTLHYIENSNEYLKQLVYLAGLSNLHLENTVDFLEPMISGEEPVSSEFIQVFSLRAVFPVVSANPDKAYEIYWPVLINRENSLELRATALVLLMEAQHEASIYMQLHQIMMADDTSHHLYNIYYKLIKGFSEENESCHLIRTHMAQQIMRSMKSPVVSQFSSSHYTFSIADGKLKVLTVVNPLTEDGISVYITYSSKYNESLITYFSIYIKLRGIEGEFLKDILQTVFDSSKAEGMLKQFIKNGLIPEDFQLEFILFSQQQVVSLRIYDKNNIEDLLKDLINALQAENHAKLSLLHATSFFNSETFFVTDIGFPGVLSVDFPNLLSLQSQTTVDDSTQAVDMNTSFDLRIWSQGSTVLKIKNTMADIWQGIINSHTSRFNFPLNFRINLKNQLNLQFKPASNKENNHNGFKWHAQTDIFTVTNSDSYDALSVSCKDCKSLTSVKSKSAQTIDRELHNNAYNLYSKIFDCEDDEATNILKSTPSFKSPNIIYTLGTVLSAGFFLEKYLLELPITGSCGYSTVYTPTQEYAVCVASTYQRNYITLSVGSSGVSDEECVSDNVIISLAIDSTNEDPSYDEEQLKGECKRKLAAGFEAKLKEQFKGKVSTCGASKTNGHEENLEWCEKEMKPQIMNCLQTEMHRSNQETVVTFGVQINELPKDIEQTIHLLINDYMEAHLENVSSNGVVGSDATSGTITLNLAKSKYSLSLHLPHKHFVLSDTLN